MGKPLYESLEDWNAGIITTTFAADEIPVTASSRALNSALSTSGGHASVRKRLGMRLMNATAITGTPSILGQFEFKKRAGLN